MNKKHIKLWAMPIIALPISAVLSCNSQQTQQQKQPEPIITEKYEITSSSFETTTKSAQITLTTTQNTITQQTPFYLSYYKKGDLTRTFVVESFSLLANNKIEVSLFNLDSNSEYEIKEIKLNNTLYSFVNAQNKSFKTKEEIIVVLAADKLSANPEQPKTEIDLTLKSDDSLNGLEIEITLQNTTTKENTDLKSLILDNKATFDLSSLSKEQEQTFSIQNVSIQNQSVTINFENLKTIPAIKVAKKEQSEVVQEDSFEVEKLSVYDIESRSAKVGFVFSKHNLKDASKNTFKLIISPAEDQNLEFTATAQYSQGNNFLNFEFNQLEAKKEYVIKNLIVNTTEVSLENLNKNFTTKEDSKEDVFSVKNFEVLETETNSAKLRLNFAQADVKNEKTKNFRLVISKKDNSNEIIEFQNQYSSGNFIDFDLPNLESNTNYSIREVFFNSQSLSFETIDFKTKSNEKTLYKFPKPQTFSKESATSISGEISNIKQIFDRKEFPANEVVQKSENNLNQIKNYFNTEMRKVIKSFYSAIPEQNLPKWAEYNYDSQKAPSSSIIPDLKVRFKSADNLEKYSQKIMLSYAQDNEINLVNSNEFIFKKNINSFIEKDFRDRKVNLNFISLSRNNDYGFDFEEKKIFRIENDIEELLKTKNTEPTTYTQDYSIQLPVEYKSFINDKNELVVKVKLSSHAGNKGFDFDSNKSANNFVLSKFGTVVDIAYMCDEDKDENFSLSSVIYENDPSAKLSSNGNFYSLNTDLSFANGKRVLPNESNSFFEEIRKRVFVVGGGTSTMLSKVKPSDPSDQRYYFITNRHVSDILQTRWDNSQVLKKFLIADFEDSKVRNASSEISIPVNKSSFEFNFWQSQDQTKRDGTKQNDGRQHADISISIIDIAPLIESAKSSNNTRVLNYLENWKNLKPLELSEKTKYLNENDYVQLYLGSFPLDAHAGFSGRRYREHIVNRIESITLSDQAAEFAKYGHFRTFIQSDDASRKLKYDLISGGSGSVVYDENGKMVALFMQNVGDDSYGFGLLSSFDYDYFGFETDNNPNSFKKKLEQAIKTNPSKFEMIKI
ncbi:hypothetical protein [Mycoplasma procyoni]|uniref:hypothetical protein n=1 Tax=Mycoplasma procyoni TaxID=568784 RepID=UPI00197C326F|nr:hypothetical protein [Mycoplasma procyoni]MBN3534409.1 hypothetical protein [Mycoplasma procyoni]